MAYLIKIIQGFLSLFGGLWVTLKCFFSQPVTLQYPDERWVLPERYRGFVKLIPPKCTSCLICAKNCPNNCIEIKFDIGEDKKRRLREFKLNFGTCLFCGICVESCPFGALGYAAEYENSEYAKERFVYNKEELIFDKPRTVQGRA